MTFVLVVAIILISLFTLGIYLSTRPMKLESMQWPNTEIAQLLPVPNSDTGKLSSESEDSLYIYVGFDTKADYDAYINQCYEQGFNLNYRKGDTYFEAAHADGYNLYITDEGHNIMYIRLRELSDYEHKDLAEAFDSTSKQTAEAKPAPEQAATAKPEAAQPETEQPKSDSSPQLVDGMRPEFKEAMDSYEEFYNDYCELMEDYMANPSDLSLITKYAEMMADLAEMDAAFAAWEDSDLNEAEMKYYIEVQSRVSQKLVEVAYD